MNEAERIYGFLIGLLVYGKRSFSLYEKDRLQFKHIEDGKLPPNIDLCILIIKSLTNNKKLDQKDVINYFSEYISLNEMPLEWVTEQLFNGNYDMKFNQFRNKFTENIYDHELLTKKYNPQQFLFTSEAIIRVLLGTLFGGIKVGQRLGEITHFLPEIEAIHLSLITFMDEFYTTKKMPELIDPKPIKSEEPLPEVTSSDLHTTYENFKRLVYNFPDNLNSEEQQMLNCPTNRHLLPCLGACYGFKVGAEKLLADESIYKDFESIVSYNGIYLCDLENWDTLFNEFRDCITNDKYDCSFEKLKKIKKKILTKDICEKSYIVRIKLDVPIKPSKKYCKKF